MWKVPNDAADPAYEDARRLGFFEWLFSSREDRAEWARRRKLADAEKRAAWQARAKAKGWRVDD